RHARFDLRRQASRHNDFRLSHRQAVCLSAPIKVLAVVIGKIPPFCKAMFGRAHPLSTAGRFYRALFLTILVAFGGWFAMPAAAAEGPSGLPLPRFATTRSTPINVRIGPGTRYGVAWVYVKAGTPV